MYQGIMAHRTLESPSMFTQAGIWPWRIILPAAFKKTQGKAKMRATLIYPKDLGKQTEDEIVEWMMNVLKNPFTKSFYSPLKYVEDLEVTDRK